MRLPFLKPKDLPDAGPLYAAIIAETRRPDWYREAGVPDTLDGRFDMIAAVLTLVLLRLEQENERTRDDSVALTETFIGDMDYHPIIRSTDTDSPVWFDG